MIYRRQGYLIVTVLVLTVAVTKIIDNQRQRSRVSVELQQLQRDSQQMQQALVYLSSSSAMEALEAIKGGGEAVRLRFIEALDQLVELANVQAFEYSVQDSGEVDRRLDYLRAAIRLELQHADVLLKVVQHLDKAASVWPHFLRGCELQRNYTGSMLTAHCVYDIYVWDVLA